MNHIHVVRPRTAGRCSQCQSMSHLFSRRHNETKAALRRVTKERDEAEARSRELERQLREMEPPSPRLPPPPPPFSQEGGTSTSGSLPQPSEIGHVFILHCSITGFAADAFLLPHDAQDSGQDGLKLTMLRGFGGRDGVGSIRQYHGKIAAEHYGGESEATIKSKVVAVVAAFLKEAGSALKGQVSGLGRPRPLLGLPLPGVGLMDKNDTIKEEGLIVEEVLPMMYHAVRDFGVDCAVCTTDSGAFRVMQVLREKHCPSDRAGPFWMLSEEQLGTCQHLASAAAEDRLALFLGAGVSFPSGLPSWEGLLETLSRRAGFSDAERASLSRLNYLDQASLIRDRIGGEKTFKEEVRRCVQRGRYTPAHAIAATLRMTAITTNYDDLYEDACQSAGGHCLRIPWEAFKLDREEDRDKKPLHVLKLHGCVSRPTSIVLTRQDYMRFEVDASLQLHLPERQSGFASTLAALAVGPRAGTARSRAAGAALQAVPLRWVQHDGRQRAPHHRPGAQGAVQGHGAGADERDQDGHHPHPRREPDVPSPLGGRL